ncbi:hypothetical protein CEXT_48371 [Caerostris extrusa]|uniref:Uncharacterized protein n=1 Tax=Caerostris extrusa TaxID=172846 RepID=A0AAV4N1N7_CAEEX|nr:hypothetical protein CEXT_48371 [Caerostris extrusa]
MSGSPGALPNEWRSTSRCYYFPRLMIWSEATFFFSPPLSWGASFALIKIALHPRLNQAPAPDNSPLVFNHSTDTEITSAPRHWRN